MAQMAGAAPALANLVITNRTGAPVEIASIGVSGAAQIDVTHECAVIAAYEACSATLTPRASQAGVYEGTVVVLQGGGGSLVTVPLTLTVAARDDDGLPFSSEGGALVALPEAVKIRARVGQSVKSRVLLANTSAAPIQDLAAASAGDSGLSSRLLCAEVAAFGHCELEVSYEPSEPGEAEGFVIVTFEGGRQKLAVPIAAEAEAGDRPAANGPSLMPMPANLRLDPANGQSSGRIVLTNMGRGAVAIQALSIAGAARFAIAHDCAVIEPGTSCSVEVTAAEASTSEVDGLLVASTGAGELVTVQIRQAAWEGGEAPTGDGVPEFTVKAVVGSRATIEVGGERLTVKAGEAVRIAGRLYRARIVGVDVELSPVEAPATPVRFPDKIVSFPGLK